MERDVEIYLEDQYLDTFFEDRIQKIVVHPLKPGQFPQILHSNSSRALNICSI